MTTFAQDIESAANGEPIEAIVIGEKGWGEWDDEANEYVPPPYAGRVLTWDDARPLLDYVYDRGWGAPDCHAITAYTRSYIIFVSQYDGSTHVNSIPRNPTPHMPIMPGG